jgi:hypothetical protein
MSCRCEHIAICHRYICATRTNTGPCLAPQCTCDQYEETD